MKIQGITIALGADASGIETALSDVNKASGKTSKELQQINKALKFDPDNVNLLQQRFDVLQEAAKNASNKLETLRQAQAEVDRQFAAGEIDESQFRAFNREVEMTEGLLRNLQNQARQTQIRINPDIDTSDIDDLDDDIDDLGDTAERAGDRIKQALAGAVAGIGLAGLAENGLAESDLQAKIAITFDVPEDSKQSVREALAEVQAYGVDGEEALEGLRKQWALNKDASDESNRSVVNSAAAIASVYGDIDFKELIQETNEIGKELEITDEQALNLVDSLLQAGFPPDQLDIIAEYGSQLRRAGYEAEQIKGIMAAASNVGSFNIDNLLDGLKEGRIRAAEMGRGLPTALEEGLRELLPPTKVVSEEQLEIMEAGFDQQEEALSKSLNSQYEATEKGFANQLEARSDSMDEQYDAVVDSYDKQRDALEDSLADEFKSFEKAANERIKLIDKEYMEKMKLIDEDRYNQLKAIDDEINGLRALTDAENKAAKDRENAEKRAELTADIANQRTKKGRRLASEKLSEFEAKLRADQVQEDRDAEIESLKIRKDGINEAADEKKEALKSEYDLLKERASQELEVDKETLKERQALELEAFDKRKNASLENLQEINSRELDALKERQAAQLSLMQETNAKELEAFQKMNDEKMELAKNPPDSAAFKAAEGQLVAWGKAIASGTNPKAFEEMTKWLNGIEDATLRNTIGTAIFGTVWEDQGDKIVKSLLGADEALLKMNEDGRTAKDVAESMDESALKRLNDAIQTMMVELAPLLVIIAEVIGKFAEFIVANPEISAAFLAIGVIVGLLAAAFIALAPAIAAIPAIMPLITGAFAALSGVFATVAGALPAIGAAIAAVAGPIGIAIAAVAALIGIVALIVKNWEPIKEFFSNLWANIVEIFVKTKDKVFEVVGGWILGIMTKFFDLKDGAIGIFESLSTAAGIVWRAMKEVLMKPVNAIKDAITGVFETISDTLTGIWDGITNKIKDSINFIIELINDFIGGMNTLKIPDWVPAIGGAGVDIPNIPMLAKGTDYFKGGPAIVGERGPELVDMPAGARVTPNDKMAGMMGTTITGNNFVIREEADVKRVARELYNMQQVEMRGR